MKLYRVRFFDSGITPMVVQATDPTEAERLVAQAWEHRHGGSPPHIRSFEVVADEDALIGDWLVVPIQAEAPPDAEKDAPVPIPTVFHNPRGVVPNASVTDALAAARRQLLSDKDARIAELERRLAELTAAAEPCSSQTWGSADQRRLRAVLDAQGGEKEEAKP